MNNGNELYALDETMERIRNRISRNKILSKLRGASDEDIFHLKEQYGERTVDIGVEIIKAYSELDELVSRLRTVN